MILDLKARLLGLRVVEQDDDHIILRIPRWMRSSMPQMAESITKDARLMGKHPTITIGECLIRIDRQEPPQ